MERNPLLRRAALGVVLAGVFASRLIVKHKAKAKHAQAVAEMKTILSWENLQTNDTRWKTLEFEAIGIRPPGTPTAGFLAQPYVVIRTDWFGRNTWSSPFEDIAKLIRTRVADGAPLSATYEDPQPLPNIEDV